MKKDHIIRRRADADYILRGILNMEMPDGEPYKTAREMIENYKKLPKYCGMRVKIGSDSEGLLGMELLLIDPQNHLVCKSVGMEYRFLKFALKAHKAYVKAVTAGMGNTSASCACFDISELRQIGVIRAPGSASDVSASTAAEVAPEVASETDDDDVKFGE